MNSLKVFFVYANNLSVAFVTEKQAHSSLASFPRYNLCRVESKWFVLLSSYTYRCLIRFKFVTKMCFVAQRTKQWCMQKSL